MTRRTRHNGLISLALAAMLALGGLMMLSGCDEAYGWDEGGSGLMDFSPYGYDYDMYDIFTSDL